MKWPPASIASQRRAADVVVGLQLAGLEDHLEVRRRPQASRDRDDLLEDLQVAAGQERAPVDDHVDLVGAGLDGVAGVGQLDVQRGAAARERGGDGGDVDAGVAEGLLGGRRPCRGRRRPRRSPGRSGRPGRGASPWRPARGPCRGCPGPRAWSGRPSGSRGRWRSALAVVLIERVPSARRGPRRRPGRPRAGRAGSGAARPRTR